MFQDCFSLFFISEMWKCALCMVVLTLTLRAMLIHIRMTHGTSPNFDLICGIEGCPRQYRIFDSFYKHVKRTHGHLYEETIHKHTVTRAGNHSEEIDTVRS